MNRLDPTPTKGKRKIFSTSDKQVVEDDVVDLLLELQNLVKVHPELVQFDIKLKALERCMNSFMTENEMQAKLISQLSKQLSDVKTFLESRHEN